MCEDQNLDWQRLTGAAGRGREAVKEQDGPGDVVDPWPQWHSSLIYVFPRQHVKWPLCDFILVYLCHTFQDTSAELSVVVTNAWLWPEAIANVCKRAYTVEGVRAFLPDGCFLHPIIWVRWEGSRVAASQWNPINAFHRKKIMQMQTFAQAILPCSLSLQVLYCRLAFELCATLSTQCGMVSTGPED